MDQLDNALKNSDDNRIDYDLEPIAMGVFWLIPGVIIAFSLFSGILWGIVS